MADDRIVIACSCERTMPLDGEALRAGCGGALHTADQLCRAQLDLYRTLLGTGAPVTVGCTQEAPLFTEVAEEMEAAGRVAFANVRETAGWSDEAAGSGPKMAALLAMAAVPAPEPQWVTLRSEGVALVYGRDETAIEVGRRLADKLDVTVLLDRPADVAPPVTRDFPILKGTVRGATGHLGAFSLRVDDYALPAPSSRTRLVWASPRDGATSTCDLVLDLTGGAPLFPAHEVRNGYLRADPGDRAAVERLVAEAANLVGEFDKPKYIAFHEGLCVHSRSRITGCTRCLDVCPTGAIAPAGDTVAIDPYVCAGCGSCASVCPTGAASYALPPADGLLARLRALILAHARAGGAAPVILLHDREHGAALIDALGKYGRGLPADVLPVQVNEVSQVGPEALAAAFAHGAVGAQLLLRAKPEHDPGPVYRLTRMVNLILSAYGYGEGVVGTVETDDPDHLRDALDALSRGTPSPRPASFRAAGTKRGVLELAFRELHRAAPAPQDAVPLAAGAPFGGLDVNVEGCTLCLSCVSACPTHALTDNPERPQLRFTESLCVQCGLCANTCPEKVITLAPRLDIAAWDAPRRLVKEEEPFHCITCARPFGTRGAIERVMEKLDDRHWMFTGEAGRRRLRVLQMCEDCRVEAMVEESFDPTGARPATRTTDDYLREREAARAKADS